MAGTRLLSTTNTVIGIGDRLTDLEKYGIYTSLAALKDAQAGDFPYTLIFSGNKTEYCYVTGDFSTQVDDVNVVALNNTPITTGALIKQGIDTISGKIPYNKALNRSMLARAIEPALSPFEFLSRSDQDSIRGLQFDPARSDRITAAINECFREASPSSERNIARSVVIPDGGYLVGNLLAGTQQTSSQSGSPVGILGASKNGVTIRAKPELTGNLFQGWSWAGVELHHLTFDTTDTTAQALDLEWKPGVGPSTQNAISQIRINGGYADRHVNLRNLNDTYPDMITVGTQNLSACCIDMHQPGGLAKILNSIWAYGYLNIGCQNGAISNCWGFGIRFAAGALNVVTINACYLYPNIANNAVLFSESFDNFQTAAALEIVSTQLIGTYLGETVDQFCDLNLYSAPAFRGCQFIAEQPMNLYSTRTRRNSFTDIVGVIDGGMQSLPSMTINEPNGVHTVCRNFMNDVTGKQVIKEWAGSIVPVVQGLTQAGNTSYTTRTGKWWREDNTVRFELRVTWSGHNGSGQLYISGLPFDIAGGGIFSLNYVGNTFGGTIPLVDVAPNGVVFYNTNGGATPLPASGDVLLTGSYKVQ